MPRPLPSSRTGSSRAPRRPLRPARPALFDPSDPAAFPGTGVPGGSAGGATVVFTDGACLGNPGPGGWAWAVDRQHFGFGSEARTTNQRMELTAVLRATGELGGPLLVVSDSTYVVNCFRDRWWAGWRARGWRNSRGEPVANRELWEALVSEVVDRRAGQIQFRWVKGHSGDAMNELVDRLANDAARNQSAGSSAPADRQVLLPNPD